MKDSLLAKLQGLVERHEELGHSLSDPEIINDQDQFRRLSQEYAQLEEVCRDYRHWNDTREELTQLRSMAEDPDPELRQMAADELSDKQSLLEPLEQRLMQHLAPKDPNDDKNIFLEIRAGTGGDEAAIFAGDLFRMYLRYGESMGWTIEILSENEGEHGGYKEIISRLSGSGVYSRLKFESGAHRVQRVPETESQGRIHTSACTVAVLPEMDDIEAIDIDPNELRIDTYRASGAGGQHVNKTDSAVRITHLPTGVVVECQDERSQHKNRARAMSLLQARLIDSAQQQQSSEQAANRKLQVGSGDRSERIRTYNFPQNRVTDHRINLTLYKLDEVIQGGMQAIIDPLTQEYQAEQLASLAE